MWVTDDEKIASVGVHLRRNVASHGIGLNVETNLEWFDRIVACGLVGKRATSFEKLGVKVEGGVEEVGRVLAEKVARYLGKPDVNGGVDGVKAVDLGEVIEQEAVEATAKEDGWAG